MAHLECKLYKSRIMSVLFTAISLLVFFGVLEKQKVAFTEDIEGSAQLVELGFLL